MFICGFTFLTFMVVEESLHLLLGGQDQHYTEESSALNASNLHEMMHGGHSHDHRNRHHHHHHHEEEDSHEEEHSGRNLVHENQPLLSVRQAYGDFGASTPESCSHLPVSCTTHMDETTRHAAHEGLSTSSSSSHRQHRQFGSFLQSTKTHKEDPYQLQEHHHHDDHIDLHLHGSILASGILMLALSIHSILAGVSIGIEKDLDGIAGTAIAILAHKSFEGFCLGSSLVNAQMDHLPFFILGISFSCATPLGILIGQFIMGAMVPEDGSTTSSGVTTIAVVQAIVAGTFLYIAIVEIGSKELLACRQELSSDAGGENNRQTIKLWKARLEVGKLLCFVFGFLAMSALAAVV
jgi:zinc transporter ZupT